MKAAPVRATLYVRLGSLIEDTGVFLLKGWNKELIAMKVNFGVKFISLKTSIFNQAKKQTKRNNLKSEHKRLGTLT